MLEVGPLARWSDVATPIRPITGRRWLSPAFRCPASRERSLAVGLPPKRRDVGFTMFRSNSGDDLAPAYYTGSRLIRVPAY